MHIYMGIEGFHQYFTDSEMGQLNRTFAHGQLWAWSHSITAIRCLTWTKNLYNSSRWTRESLWPGRAARPCHESLPMTRKARTVWSKIFKFWFTAVFNLNYSDPDLSQSSFCMKPLGPEADWLWCPDPEMKLRDFKWCRRTRGSKVSRIEILLASKIVSQKKTKEKNQMWKW